MMSPVRWLGIGLLGRAGNRDHIVERHHEVGDDDRLDRGPKLVTRRYVAVSVRVARRSDQLDADPQQHQPADQLEQGHVQQRDCDSDQDHAQHDRARAAPQDAEAPLLRGQVAAGQRNQQRIVTTEQDVDHDDLADGDPVEIGEPLERFGHRAPLCASARRAQARPMTTTNTAHAADTT